METQARDITPYLVVRTEPLLGPGTVGGFREGDSRVIWALRRHLTPPLVDNLTRAANPGRKKQKKERRRKTVAM